MSIDAMYWVWLHSQSKGTGRHCLLAVANKASGPDCTASVSTPEFMQWANAAKSSVVTAVDKLLDSGELVLVREAAGTRAALYQLPFAVGYTRPGPGARGTETGPLASPRGSGNKTPNPFQGYENRTPAENARGPETGPQGYENRTPSGPETGPHYQHHNTKPVVVESWETATPAAEQIPDAVRPLVDGMTAAGLGVRWPFRGDQWFEIHALMKRSGVQALVDYARRAAAGARTPVLSAKYFLGGWRELPPLPQPGTPVQPPLLAVINGAPPAPPSRTDARFAAGLALAARLEAEEQNQ